MKKINLKTYFKKRKQRISFFGVSPQFDWGVIVWTITLSLIGGIIGAIYLYIQVNNGSMFEVEEDTAPQIELDTKKKKIQETAQRLIERNFDESTSN